MIKHLTAGFGVIIVAGLISCSSSLKVTSDYDRSVNFQQYKTFQINVPDPSQQSISMLNQRRIVEALKAEMIKKGFTEATNADLIVQGITILKDKTSVSSNTNYYGYGGMYRPYGWGGYGYGYGGVSGYTTYNVYNYKDGSLIIDIADAKTQKLIWEGIGNKEIDKPLSDPEKQVPAAIAAIMASFPPEILKVK